MWTTAPYDKLTRAIVFLIVIKITRRRSSSLISHLLRNKMPQQRKITQQTVFPKTRTNVPADFIIPQQCAGEAKREQLYNRTTKPRRACSPKLRAVLPVRHSCNKCRIYVNRFQMYEKIITAVSERYPFRPLSTFAEKHIVLVFPIHSKRMFFSCSRPRNPDFLKKTFSSIYDGILMRISFFFFEFLCYLTHTPNLTYITFNKRLEFG